MNVIDRLSSISVKDFYKNYLKENKPCILESDFTKDWICINEWLDVEGKINIKSILSHKNLSNMLSVANCNEYYFDSHKLLKMSACEYVDYWVGTRKENILYFKDWHYFLENKHLGIHKEYFKLLPHFSKDWLNEFYDIRTDCIDDYRFVYVGVKDSWTPFHADVLRSYSWSANISGIKTWYILPEGFEERIPENCTDLRKVLKELSDCIIVVDQSPGEIIFIPSGWWHQVHNKTDCVSINHNWMNGMSIKRNWNYLIYQLDQVYDKTREVKDTVDYINECQNCLKALCGVNLQELVCMVEFILYKRICMHLNNCCEIIPTSITGCTKLLQKFLESRLNELSANLTNILDSSINNFDPIVIDIRSAICILYEMCNNTSVKELEIISDDFKKIIMKYK